MPFILSHSLNQDYQLSAQNDRLRYFGTFEFVLTQLGHCSLRRSGYKVSVGRGAKRIFRIELRNFAHAKHDSCHANFRCRFWLAFTAAAVAIAQQPRSGVKFPFVIRMIPGTSAAVLASQSTIHVEKIEDNVPIDVGKFAKPQSKKTQAR